jgi:hypothetical protein
MGPETKKNSAAEDQQQFTGLDLGIRGGYTYTYT